MNSESGIWEGPDFSRADEAATSFAALAAEACFRLGEGASGISSVSESKSQPIQGRYIVQGIWREDLFPLCVSVTLW
jgi:hypothetical protein